MSVAKPALGGSQLRRVAPLDTSTNSGSTRANSDATPSPPTNQDVAVLCGRTKDGKGVGILRQRHGQLEAGVVRPIEPGKPIHNEVVRLKPRPDMPQVCDVEVAYDPAADGARLDGASAVGDPSSRERTPRPAGPPKVATARYRKNWDTIWKRSRSKNTLN